jgi:SAM-dependent methyltransferase
VTRASYDIVVASYARLVPDAHDGRPLDAAIMRAFAELTEGPIGDLGCGTGRITRHLHELGLDAFGVDLLDGMLEQARKLYPHLNFAQGDIANLDLEDDSLGGAVVWYSTVHMPTETAPWQDRKRHLGHAYGHDVYWHDIAETCATPPKPGSTKWHGCNVRRVRTKADRRRFCCSGSGTPRFARRPSGCTQEGP